MSTKLQNFIKKSNKKFPNLISFTKCEYIHSNTKVILICNICQHERLVKPNQHLSNKFHCPVCSYKTLRKKNKISLERIKYLFIDVHNYKYQYDWATYVNSSTKMRIICPIHGEFWQRPRYHKNGHGCLKCGTETVKKKTRFPFEIVLADFFEIHQNNYIYYEDTYKNTDTKMKMKCKKCELIFHQSPDVHKRGRGCPNCKIPIGENIISTFLTKNNIIFTTQQTFIKCVYKQKLHFDFYLPKHNICIEYDGIQHFKPINFFGGEESFKLQLLKDNTKTEYCKENNIRLVRIPYWEKDNIEEILNKEL